MKVKKESEKAGLKLNVQKLRSWHLVLSLMASRRRQSRSSDKFSFLGLQNHWGWWLQPWNWKTLASWKESYDKLRQHIKKYRHYFANKSAYSQSYGFDYMVPIVVYGYKSWTIKKTEHRRIDAFELWCWRSLLRFPWTARSNQSILKEINPEYSLERLILKLKFQYFWPPDVKNWLIRKDPNAGKDWGWEEQGMTEDEMVGWHHWLNAHEFE